MKKILWSLLFSFILPGMNLPVTIAQNQGLLPDGQMPGQARQGILEYEEGEPRFLVTYMNSQTGGAIRSATVVSVTNLEKKACDIRVDYFRGFAPDTPFCQATFLGLEPGETTDICSRGVPGSITTCNSICAPQLFFHEGKAIVNSNRACRDIGVEARVYYTTGNNQDGAVSAVSNSKIVSYRKGNDGD